MSQLAEVLRAEGGLLAGAVAPNPGDAEFDRLADEAVREGYRLHYGEARVVVTDDDDLALLAGDRLYAVGLDRLADEGDLDSIAALADLISACAQAHAEGDPARAAHAWGRYCSRPRG